MDHLAPFCFSVKSCVCVCVRVCVCVCVCVCVYTRTLIVAVLVLMKRLCVQNSGQNQRGVISNLQDKKNQ